MNVPSQYLLCPIYHTLYRIPKKLKNFIKFPKISIFKKFKILKIILNLH
jgi:hypothetical protein